MWYLSFTFPGFQTIRSRRKRRRWRRRSSPSCDFLEQCNAILAQTRNARNRGTAAIRRAPSAMVLHNVGAGEFGRSTERNAIIMKRREFPVISLFLGQGQGGERLRKRGRSWGRGRIPCKFPCLRETRDGGRRSEPPRGKGHGQYGLW